MTEAPPPPPSAVVYPSLRNKQVRQLQKTEMCKFHMLNRCGKGMNCSFAHDISEIRDKPNLNRTSMCKTFLMSGNCNKPNCAYAHDERELRTTEGFFKTKLCRFASRGRCKHGSSCRFAHSQQELNQAVAASNEAALLAEMPTATLDSSQQEDPQVPDVPEGGGQPRMRTQVADGRRHAQRQHQAPTEINMSGSDSMSDQRTGRNGTSDQSTRADTSASVPTPEGSGDSGPEERGRQRRTGDRAQTRHCTTMMMTNVPQFLTQGALISLLEDLSSYMRGGFDFFYCPWDPYQDRNLGYAIINFFLRSVAGEFEKQWANQPLLPRTHGSKRLRIMPAALQGRAANLRHFSGFSLAHHVDPRFRPLVRAGPKDKLQPMALSEEIGEPENRGSDQGAVAFECDAQQNVTAPAAMPDTAAGSETHPWSPEILAAALAASGTRQGMGVLPQSSIEQAATSLAEPTRSNPWMTLLANSGSETSPGMGGPQLGADQLSPQPARMQAQAVAEMAKGMMGGLGQQVAFMPRLGAADTMKPPVTDQQVQMGVASDVLAASYSFMMPPGTAGANSGMPSALAANALCVPIFPQILSGLGQQRAVSQLQLQYLQQLEAFGACPDRGM